MAVRPPRTLKPSPFSRFEAIVDMRCKYTSPYLRYEYEFESHEDAEPADVVTTTERLATSAEKFADLHRLGLLEPDDVGGEFVAESVR